MKGKKKKKNKKKFPVGVVIVIIIALVLVGAAIWYFFFEKSKSDVFFENTYVNGINVGGMGVEEANELVIQQGPGYHMEVSFRDGSQESVDGESIGLSYDVTDQLASMMNEQRAISWFAGNEEVYEYEAKLEPSYDPEMLETLMASWPQLDQENMTDPTNADLVYDEEKIEFYITPETQGNSFDTEVVKNCIRQEVEDFDETPILVEEMGIYKEPTVFSDDEDLNSRKDQFNLYLSSVITYELNGNQIVLDKNRTKDWISISDEGKYVLDDGILRQNVSAFVAELDSLVESVENNTWEFDTTAGTTITLENGTLSRALDSDAEIEQTVDELKSGAVVTRQPILANANGDSRNHGLGGTYVELDLSKQHLWAYDDGNLKFDMDIISGKMQPRRYTPEGMFYVYFKERDRVLHGTDAAGNPTYATQVQYWMPFNEGIGMHDAPWQVEFGGDTYLTNGSHGCINMKTEDAAAMYEWVEIGTPVVVYYSEGFTLDPDEPDPTPTPEPTEEPKKKKDKKNKKQEETQEEGQEQQSAEESQTEG